MPQKLWTCWKIINTSYLADSYILFTLKLVSGQIFCFSRWIRSSTYGKQKISVFPPCGKGQQEGGKIATILYHFHKTKFWARSSYSFNSSVGRATDDGSKVRRTNPALLFFSQRSKIFLRSRIWINSFQLLFWYVSGVPNSEHFWLRGGSERTAWSDDDYM